MFQPYPKISDKLNPRAKLSGDWIAREKIHGANVAIVATEENVVPCRRKAVLQDEELGTFFGLITIWPNLYLAAQKIRAHLGKDCILYGELCGGIYPHHETSPAITPVQGGIYYSPHLEYFLFDVYIISTDMWLSDMRVRQLAELSQLPMPPLIAQGTYQQMMRLNIDFQSLVSDLLGYPKLANNRAEGLVIKPNRDMKTDERVIIKQKRQAFKDTLPKNNAQRFLLKQSQSTLISEAARMLTPARVSSARSKIGPGGYLVQAILEDIIEDLVYTGYKIAEEEIEILIEYLRDPIQDLVATYN